MKTKVLFFLIFLVIGSRVSAQLCTGSLGDPVVNLTFGTGAGIGPALPVTTTTYNYIANTCPSDGSYTISSSTIDCFGASWHSLTEDHTPNDVDGRFMLINASFVPGDFFLDTIRGLCPNTSYEFAAWVKNVLKSSACSGNGIRPNLTFKVETTTGTVLTTVNSGDIPNELTAVWKQYGAFFVTPAGLTDVVIRLTNNAPGGCGNDLALDDITFRPCGPQVNATVGSTNLSSIFACGNDPKDFTLSASFSAGVYTNPEFQWQVSTDNGISWANIAGATSNSFIRTPTPTGLYLYRMLIADAGNINLLSCRLASNPIRITVTNANAVVNPQAVGCTGTDIDITAGGGISYNWSGPNGFTSSAQNARIAQAALNDAGWYKVMVTDTTGCSDTDSINVLVNPSPVANAGIDVAICEGTSVSLDGSGSLRYLWSPSATLSNDTIASPVAQPVDTTIYRLMVTNEFNCSDDDSVQVNIWKIPTANAGPDKKTRLGYPVLLEGSFTGSDIRTYWTPATGLSDPSILKPRANPTASTTYTLHAESIHGCGNATDMVFVKVFEKMLIPNVFSPNGDGINDTWVIEPLDIFVNAETKIFNRYGQLVFSSKGYPKPWDGTRNGNPLPVGTYYYVIDLKLDAEPVVSGAVLIIR